MAQEDDSRYGKRGPFWRAMDLQWGVFQQLRADVAALAEADPRLATMLDVFPLMALNAEVGMDALAEAAENLDDDTMETINTVIDQSGTIPFSEAYLRLPPAEKADQLKKKNGSGKEAVATLGKAFDLLGQVPGVGLLFTILSKILNIVSQFLEGEASATESERQIEEKLHQLGERLGKVITGEEIPVGSGTTYTPSKPSVKSELEELERGLAYIMDLPQGRDFPDQPERGTPVSLTDIKNYLGYIADIPDGIDFPKPPDRTSGVEPVSLTDIKNFLAYIADVPDGMPFPRRPAQDAGVKPVSLTDISAMIKILIEGLAFAIDLPAGEDFPQRPPDGVKPVSLTMINETVKKIYVTDEGTFSATSAADSRMIQVRAQSAPLTVNLSPAFDLSGWLDLSEMRDGDAVTVRIDAAFAGRGPLRFNQVTFVDAQARPLKHFRDFAAGVEQVVGTSVDITLSQRQSADNFNTPINLAYQFVVESP